MLTIGESEPMKARRETLPYTYFLKWTALNKWYYGVCHAQGCHPSEFWKKYFTSSNHVENLLKEFGNPDFIQIRRTFKDAKRAIWWEKKVLLRMNVLNRVDSLNMNIAGSIIVSPLTYANIVQKRKEDQLKYNTHDQSKEKNPMWAKRWVTNGINNQVIKKDTPTPLGWRDGRITKTTVRKNKQQNLKLKNIVWITNGLENKIIHLNESIPEHWYRGHTVQDKNRLKASAHTIWITDGLANRKVHNDFLIPDGWHRGRSNSFTGRCRNK